jgi:hypothetical protein
MKSFRIEIHYNYDKSYDKSKTYTVDGRSLVTAVGRALRLFKKETPRERIKVGKILFFTL